MSRSTAAPPTRATNGRRADGSPPTEQTGSPLFAELVWAHHRYERARHEPGANAPKLQEAYLEKLDEFQKRVGRLEHAYWSRKDASAVAMTVREQEGGATFGRLGSGLAEYDQVIAIHRLTDWVTSDAPRIADLLHECDLLAIRVGEVLRGTPERIAMRSILNVQEHLLGFVERNTVAEEPAQDDKEAEKRRKERETKEKTLATAQHHELAVIEGYYHRAASRAGRLVYITGMLMGLVPVAVLTLLTVAIFRVTGRWTSEEGLLLLCAGTGAIGAFVSAISRMGKPERGKFNVDFELGRPLIRRLGLYRPFLGAIAGVALYALLASGIAQVEVNNDQEFAYYGFAAFLAGFSERFATVMFGSAEKRFSEG